MVDFGYIFDTEAEDDPYLLGNKVPFQFQPTELGTEHESGFKVIAVPGHSNGVQQFAGGGELLERLKLTFIGDDPDPAWADNRARWFSSLTFPDYDTGGNLIRGPHTVLYVVGQWKNLRCKVVSCKVTPGATFDRDTRYPRVVVVDLVLRVFNDTAIDYSAVRP